MPRKNNPLTFRCSPSEAIEIAEASRIAGISRSGLIRKGALAAAAEAMGGK
jgi:uncharacterized protein (DUF1778 family)